MWARSAARREASTCWLRLTTYLALAISDESVLQVLDRAQHGLVVKRQAFVAAGLLGPQARVGAADIKAWPRHRRADGPSATAALEKAGEVAGEEAHETRDPDPRKEVSGGDPGPRGLRR